MDKSGVMIVRAFPSAVIARDTIPVELYIYVYVIREADVGYCSCM